MKNGKGINHKALIENKDALKESLHSDNGRSRCLIIDEARATHGYRYLAPGLLPKNSVPVIDDGQPTYYLGFNGSELWPIDYLPADNKNKTPQDCFEATSWEELDGILKVSTSLTEKIKFGIFVALIIAFLVIIFFRSAALGG